MERAARGSARLRPPTRSTTMTTDRPHLDRLADILANTYALAVKTHAAHWNVTGPGFYADHQLFEEQYKGLIEAADTIAERLRALAIAAPVDMAALSSLSTLPRGSERSDAATLAGGLCADHHALSTQCRACVAVSEQAGDVATSDLLIARCREHDKAAWMLGATAGETGSRAMAAATAHAAASGHAAATAQAAAAR
jgi:starvation-inducible DNA-binding protein